MSKSVTPAPSAASGLTSEQLHRIELNRKRAQERLQSKRRHPCAQQKQQQQQLDHIGGTQSAPGPPPAKLPATKDSHHLPLASIAARKPDSAVSSHQYSSSSRLSDLHLPSSSSSTSPHPVASLTTQSQTVTTFRPHPQSTGMAAHSVTHATMATKKPALIFAQPKSASTYSSSYQTNTADSAASSSTTSGSVPSHSAGLSAKAPAQDKTYIPLKAKIKACFVLVSKEKFEVRVPYDTGVINVFKKINTRNYDARNSLWSFGIEDLSHLADLISKECKHVEMELPPRPVVELFRSLKAIGGGGGKSKLVSAATGTMDWSRINRKLASTLMHFQKEGVEYAVKRDGRVLLADDMGLGKTLQAIAVMEYYQSDWPLLVVCPSSVRLTWAEALKRWIPSLHERDINVILTAKGFTLDSLVSVISYDLAVRMAAELKARNYGAVITDESHFLKNYRTARYKAVVPLVKNAKRSLLLSGTPALSRPIELFTQINMLDRNFRSIKLVQFGVRYCNGKKSHFGWDFSGASNMQELQLYMEEAIMIRRMKNDVLDQLPEKRRQMILLDLSTTKVKSKDLKQLKDELHEAGKLKAKDRKMALLPLYEKTGRIKIFAINYILDLLEGGRKVIVFGHHKAVLDSICDTLITKGYGHIRIDGRTAADMRQTYCDQFQHDEKCFVAVLSITAANAGLTLTASSTVVFAELFWNPGILIQAEDRAYRIGQHNSVNIHYLVAQDTADDYIWLLIQTKLDVLHQAGLAKEDFSKADTTSLKATTQKTLFECFGDLLFEDNSNSTSNLPQAEGISDSVSSVAFEAAPSPQCECSSDLSTTGNMSNWFDELDENDFNLIDMNM